MKLVDTTSQLFKPKDAERKAAILNKTSDDGWTYKADHDPKGTGWSRIEVYDETGEFVANM